MSLAAGQHRPHRIEHDPFEQPAQGARAGSLLEGLRGKFPERVLGKLEFDAFHRHQLRKLLDQRVLGIGEDGNQLFLSQFGENRDHGQTPNELGNEAKTQQILGFDVFEDAKAVHGGGAGALLDRVEPHHVLAEAPEDDFLRARRTRRRR